MRLYCDVYQADGTRLTDGPIVTATAANVTRTLDGCGSIALDFPAADRRVVELLTNKRRVHVFVDNGDGLRELGRLIVEKSGLKVEAGSWVRTIDGPDNLAELKFKNVRRGRKFDAATVNTIVDTLLGLVAGWARSGSVTNTVSARFDGASVLKALVELVQQQGIHFRQGSTFGTVEIGAFGDAATLPDGTPLVIENIASYDAEPPDHVLLVSSLTLLEDSEELINWLEPIGAGDGDAAITLEQSTRTSPYIIQTETGPDGRTVYYLQDTTSIATYGQVEKTAAFKDITLVGTSAADQIAAANALYDVAAATLSRFKDPYKSYRVECRKPRTNILPGDKLRLLGNFEVRDTDGGLVDVIDVDAEFWVIQVAETLGSAGHSVQLQIANIDRHEVDEAEIVVGAIEDIRIANLSVKPYFSNSGFVYQRQMDNTHTAVLPIDITERVQALNGCTLRLVTRPFRSNASAAASGGGSAATSASGGGSTESSTAVGLSTGLQIPLGMDHRHDIVAHSHNVTIPSHTHGVTIPNHVHAIDYGIEDDTDYPDTVRIAINGVDRTSALGGPWGVGGTAIDVELEIADYINLTTLQQRHTVTVSCDSGQGEIECTVELYQTIQSVSVFA